MEPIHVEDPAVEVVPTVQTPEKDAIVASVTDDALVMAHEAQAATPSPEEIVTIAQGAQDGGMIGVVLAIVAVLGGGAGWKFYSQSSKQKADLATKQAELAHDLAISPEDLAALTTANFLRLFGPPRTRDSPRSELT
jgi:hypothetical protein